MTETEKSILSSEYNIYDDKKSGFDSSQQSKSSDESEGAKEDDENPKPKETEIAAVQEFLKTEQ